MASYKSNNVACRKHPCDYLGISGVEAAVITVKGIRKLQDKRLDDAKQLFIMIIFCIILCTDCQYQRKIGILMWQANWVLLLLKTESTAVVIFGVKVCSRSELELHPWRNCAVQL